MRKRSGELEPVSYPLSDSQLEILKLVWESVAGAKYSDLKIKTGLSDATLSQNLTRLHLSRLIDRNWEGAYVKTPSSREGLLRAAATKLLVSDSVEIGGHGWPDPWLLVSEAKEPLGTESKQIMAAILQTIERQPYPSEKGNSAMVLKFHLETVREEIVNAIEFEWIRKAREYFRTREPRAFQNAVLFEDELNQLGTLLQPSMPGVYRYVKEFWWDAKLEWYAEFAKSWDHKTKPDVPTSPLINPLLYFEQKARRSGFLEWFKEEGERSPQLLSGNLPNAKQMRQVRLAFKKLKRSDSQRSDYEKLMRIFARPPQWMAILPLTGFEEVTFWSNPKAKSYLVEGILKRTAPKELVEESLAEWDNVNLAKKHQDSN